MITLSRIGFQNPTGLKNNPMYILIIIILKTSTVHEWVMRDEDMCRKYETASEAPGYIVSCNKPLGFVVRGAER